MPVAQALLLPALPAPAAVPVSIAQSLGELPFGSQSRVCTAEGRIDAYLAYAGYERFNGTAKYALRVLNNTPLPARARLYCVRRDGSKLSAYPLDFEIAPYALRDDLIPVRVDVLGPYERALVEIISPNSFFTVEAPAPQPERRPWMRWAAAALAPLVFVGATGLAWPRILGVQAPLKAIAGTTIEVPLQVSGIGTVEYDFKTREGVQLAAGLVHRSGVLRLTIPARAAGAPYSLHVRMRNVFAGAQQGATIGAIVPPSPKPKPASGAPEIGELAVHPSSVQAGGKVMVEYATNAFTGTVWLVDLQGRTWASAPLTRMGASTLEIPQAAAGREMRVVVHAQKGNEHAQSAVGITVLPQAAAAVPTQDAPAQNPSSAQPQIELSSQVVSPGESVTVRVSGMQGDVRITLMNSVGTTLEQGETSADDGGVAITAPSVTGVTTFYVVASFSDGMAEQSVVHRLVVTPR